MHVHLDLRVQLLGNLEVRRPHGDLIEATAWRTGKTMDLVRLLALGSGRPVRPDHLIAQLWPDAPPERARGSLRTAASQIRRAVGTNCVVRRPEGLVLEVAWVDVLEFRKAAGLVAQAVAAGHHHRAVDLARSADRLYLGDFRAHDDASAWARGEREGLRRTRLTLLCDAAASALTIGADRTALDFAHSAVHVDPSSEVAHRLLMQAHAASGEVAGALRVFESYRARLATELGVDPSPQTQALHLQLLRGHSA